MRQERSELAQWLYRNWFLVSVWSAAAMLAVVEMWVQLTFHPPLVVTLTMGAICFAALVAFAVLLLRLRRPVADLRYRWQTRDVDRAMKRPDASSTASGQADFDNPRRRKV